MSQGEVNHYVQRVLAADHGERDEPIGQDRYDHEIIRRHWSVSVPDIDEHQRSDAFLFGAAKQLVPENGIRHSYLGVSADVAHEHHAELLDYWDAIALGTTTPPPGFPNYPLLIYHTFRGNTLTVGADPTMVTATVAIIPEPATIWLTASGLAGVLAIVRRRRCR